MSERSWTTIGLVSTAIISTSSLLYYFITSSKPKLIYKKTEENKKILESVKKLDKVYYPPIYLLNSHVHTILATALFRSTNPKLVFEREIIKDEEGGSVALDWIKPTNELPSNAPVLIIYPGVTGSSQGNYVHQIGTHFSKLNYRVVCINHRGINSKLTSYKTTCASFTTDIKMIINHVKTKHENSHVFCSAYSMGANLLLKYLGQEKNTQLTAAVSVSNPFDFNKASGMLGKYFSKKFYSETLAASARNIIIVKDKVDVEAIKKSKTLKEFDILFTTKIHGYKTVEDYYNDSSCSTYINDIQIPVLALNARDDPFVDETALGHDNGNIILGITEYGGHLGFLEGMFLPCGSNWTVEIIEQYFNHFLSKEK